jgi:hypothetical protein
MTGPDDIILDLGGKITDSHDQILEYVDLLLDPEEDLSQHTDALETSSGTHLILLL